VAGPTGPLELSMPRGRLHREEGTTEWSSKILPRYQRRITEINEAIAMTYLSGGNTRRIRGALRPLLKDAPLSKSAVSRVVTTLKAEFDSWRKRSLEGLDVVYLYLDAFALKVRRDRRVQSVPVLAAVVVLADGQKQLVSLELCASESAAAWKGFVQDLDARGLRSPILCIIDGNPGLHGAVERVWPKAKIQRCTVHKLRNLERKAPKHSYEEIKEDYHAIVYAGSKKAAGEAWKKFERKWSQRCPVVVASLNEGGSELLTFFEFPQEQWKTLRTTNVIERINEEFRRRVKTQCSLPNDDAAGVLLFGLVASGQIKLRRIDGHAKLLNVVRKASDNHAVA
jgi:putative transposase